ncbi:response regulator transcription factor [Bdellovibrio sp. HCB337]|uniref:response regulator transcription factor n=1 Tax=Bdellovibrio sp. HCB337 TaxID=3394358 RepID=UPI0039A70BE1
MLANSNIDKNNKAQTTQKTSKNSKILVLQGPARRLDDVLKALTPSFSQIEMASKFEEVQHRDYDIIFVDYSVSDMSSILLYKKLIQQGSLSLVPAVFIADTKAYDHRLNAFEMGAADFLTRPFDNKEIVEKCRLHIKNRRRIAEDQSIHIGNLSLHPESQEVFVNGENVALTQLEYKILHFLLSTPRQVVTRTEIYESVWGPALSSSGRLDTQLYNLKKKLTKFNGKIKSVNKVGMRILIGDSTFSQEPKKKDPRSQSQEQRP